MANPQKENGYTPIANEIMEALFRAKLNGSQFRILLVVFRYTYGFNRKSHNLSLSFLSKATDINERQVRRELSKLMDYRILIEVDSPTKSSTRSIKFNKNYNEWVNLTSGQNRPEGKIAHSTEGELDRETEGELVPQEIKKEKFKENYLKSIFDYYISLGLIKHRSDFTKTMETAIKRAIKENNYNVEYCKTLLDRHKRVVQLSKEAGYPVKVRGFAEFFGQKAYNASYLICTEYEEGGKLYEQYLAKEDIPQQGPNENNIIYLNNEDLTDNPFDNKPKPTVSIRVVGGEQ